MDEELIEKVIDAVKNGASLRATAKKNNIPLSTVAYWCNEHGVSSEHTPSSKKATDEEIIDEIKKNKIMSVREIEEAFGYHKNALRRRLKNLLSDKKINYIVIPGGGGKTSNIFKGYIDTRIYYVNKSDLNKWIEKKLPKHIPGHLKRAISQRLRDSGIDFEFEKIEKKAVVVSEKVYKKIKDKAKKKGISMSEYLKDVT